MEKRNTVYRLPPCSRCDVTGIECWLEDMAGKGLHLKSDQTTKNLIFQFEKGAPGRVRYRLLADYKEPTALDYMPIPLYNGVWPDREEEEVFADYGWEYVAAFYRFYIYRTSDPRPMELETDSQVTALALRAVRQWREIDIAYLLLAIVIFPLGFLAHFWDLLLYIAMEHPLIWLAFGCALLLRVLYSVYDLVRLERLRRLLSKGERPDRQAARIRQRKAYQVIPVLIFCLFLAAGLGGLKYLAFGDQITFLDPADYPGDPPVPVLAEVLPEALTWEEGTAADEYWESASLFCSQRLSWRERRVDAAVINDRVPGYYYSVDHNRFRSAKLAQMYARAEYNLHYRSDATTRPIPGLEDYPMAFMRTEGTGTYLLIQRGDAVLTADLGQSKVEAIPTETWLPRFAAALKD